MAHPNTREMDVARSLLHMALPGDIQADAPANDHPEAHQNEFITRPMRQRRIKRENNADTDVGFGIPPITYYQPAFPHAQAQAPVNQWTAVNNSPQHLRDHLIRQQVIAGITPDNFLSMNIPPVIQENVNRQRAPALLQITNDGVTVPHIQGATFNPQPPYYTQMPGEDYEGGGFANQFLRLNYEGQDNQNHVFERPITATNMNAAGNQRSPAHLHPLTPPASALPHNFGRRNMYHHQGYYDTASPLQNFGSYPHGGLNQIRLLNAPTNIAFATGVDPIHDQAYKWKVKPDPDAEQDVQIPGHFTQYIGVKSEADLQDFNCIPGVKMENLQPVSNLDLLERVPAFAQHEEYGTGNTDGVEDVVLTAGAEHTQELEPPVIVRHTFSIFLAVLDHPEIALQLTRHLRVHDIMSLQAVSRSFRAFVIKYMPRIIKLQTQCRLRTASYVFPWRCYQNLWYTRPAAHTELPQGTILCANDSVVAYCASFRWLQMIRHRDHTVYYIIKALESTSYGFPLRFKSAVLKIWLLMDIPDMKRRVWTVQNPSLWRDLDLFGAILFIVRLDMFVKLKRGNYTGGQRRLIMAQPSLTFCYKVLTGRALSDDKELLEALVRWRYIPLPEQMNDEEIFGVPFAEVGSLQYEGYGTGRERNAKLLRPDQLILREAQRRRLDMKEMYQRIFIHAQEKMFTLCDRHHSPWDVEMRIMLEKISAGHTFNSAVRLD